MYGCLTRLTPVLVLWGGLRINAQIITTLPPVSIAGLRIHVKHGDSKAVANLLRFLLAAIISKAGGIWMALIKLLAAGMRPLENLLRGKRFAVPQNHPTPLSKIIAVVIIQAEVIATCAQILTMQMRLMEMLVVQIQDILLNSDVNVN